MWDSSSLYHTNTAYGVPHIKSKRAKTIDQFLFGRFQILTNRPLSGLLLSTVSSGVIMFAEVNSTPYIDRLILVKSWQRTILRPVIFFFGSGNFKTYVFVSKCFPVNWKQDLLTRSLLWIFSDKFCFSSKFFVGVQIGSNSVFGTMFLFVVRP